MSPNHGKLSCLEDHDVLNKQFRKTSINKNNNFLKLLVMLFPPCSLILMHKMMFINLLKFNHLQIAVI